MPNSLQKENYGEFNIIVITNVAHRKNHFEYIRRCRRDSFVRHEVILRKLDEQK